ncbi:TrmH family RNA methyltransferase [Pirellulaceae bacterium SH501]
MNSTGNSRRTPPVISSAKNEWVQQVVRLHRAKDRYSQRRFLVEGEHAVQEAIRTGWPIESLIATERYLHERGDWLAHRASGPMTQPVSESVMLKLATTETPDGIIAVGCFPDQEQNDRYAFKASKGSLFLAAERLQDPGNVGTLIRSSVACGADGVFLSEGSVDPYHPKVMRATAGQWFRNPPVACALQERIRQWKEQGIRVLGAAAGGSSYWDFDLKVPTAFVLGNEGAGLSEAISSLLDDVISIPMKDQVESLNVAMTGTLLLYEAYRQRR